MKNKIVEFQKQAKSDFKKDLKQYLNYLENDKPVFGASSDDDGYDEESTDGPLDEDGEEISDGESVIEKVGTGFNFSCKSEVDEINFKLNFKSTNYTVELDDGETLTSQTEKEPYLAYFVITLLQHINNSSGMDMAEKMQMKKDINASNVTQLRVAKKNFAKYINQNNSIKELS